MKVIKVEWSDETSSDDRYRVWFEHNGTEWFKYFHFEYMKDIQDFLNSVIEDTKARHTKWD